jgi:hypothetical protein
MINTQCKIRIVLDVASENIQTLIKMLFQKMTSHCMACQLERQSCFQECIFHPVRTAVVEAGSIIVMKGCMDKIHTKNESKYDGNSRELTVMTTNLSVVGSGPI